MRIPALAVAMSLIVGFSTARAATLIEAEAGGEDLRIVVDRKRARVMIEGLAERYVIDLERGLAFAGDATRPVHSYFRPGHDDVFSFRLERFGPGPMIAGHASLYHVLFLEDEVCAEVLASAWMAPFLDPALRAMSILEELTGGPLSAAPGDTGPCASLPITTLAAAGWPLLVGKIDEPSFRTKSVRFDYQPERLELALPPAYEPPPVQPEPPA